MAFSPNGDRLVSASHGTWVRVWDLEGNLAHAFQPPGALGYPDQVLGVGISPDGTQKMRTLEEYLGPVGILFFSPDSSLLLSSDWVETRIWQVEDGQLLYVGKATCP